MQSSPPAERATQVSPLREADLMPAVALLAGAFRDNPLNRAVIRSDDPDRRLRSNLHGMRGLLPVARDHGCVLGARSDGRLVGVLVSSPPGCFPLPAPGLVQRLRCLIGQGWNVTQRWGEVYEALELLHPLEPHWYLGTLGVEPSQQRRGVGAALVARWVIEVDREGLPAYLETDRERNVDFYGRAGFEVAGETQVLGVPIWRMTRS